MKTWLEWVEFKMGGREVEMATQKLHRDKAGPERQVTGRTGSFLKMENAERRKEEETDDAKGGGDPYRSKVLEQTGGNGIEQKWRGCLREQQGPSIH